LTEARNLLPKATFSAKFGLTIALVVVGLAGRTAVDKVLALRGGAELVALWAQISSVIEVVVGVVAAGVGTGLVVYVARSKRLAVQHEHLHEALRIGLRVALPVALAIGTAGWVLSDLLSGGKIAPWAFAIAAVAGCIGVIPMLVSNCWLGQQRYGLMLAMAVAQTAVVLVASYAAPEASVLVWIAVVQASPALVLILLPKATSASERFRRRAHPIRRYILPGLSIGILSPLSMLLARSIVGEAISWHDAGVFQALFRVADWICTFAGSYLSLRYLPCFAAARSGPALAAELLNAAKTTLLPSAIALGALFLLHRPLLAMLYDPGVQASGVAAGLFFAGSLVRIASWIPLLALYTMRRTREIAVGELLSLPLFVVLMIAAGNLLTLELAGALWLFAFCAYAAFNLLAVRRIRA